MCCTCGKRPSRDALCLGMLAVPSVGQRCASGFGEVRGVIHVDRNTPLSLSVYFEPPVLLFRWSLLCHPELFKV